MKYFYMSTVSRIFVLLRGSWRIERLSEIDGKMEVVRKLVNLGAVKECSMLHSAVKYITLRITKFQENVAHLQNEKFC